MAVTLGTRLWRTFTSNIWHSWKFLSKHGQYHSDFENSLFFPSIPEKADPWVQTLPGQGEAMVQKWSSQEEKLHVWQNMMDTNSRKGPEGKGSGCSGKAGPEVLRGVLAVFLHRGWRRGKTAFPVLLSITYIVRLSLRPHSYCADSRNMPQD